MTNDPRPIGILGGTFHPIHKGHIMMAHIAMAQLDLKQVWFLPDGMPPHKSISCVTPQQRLEMVRLAVEDEADFVVTEREVAREGYTYTVDTMRELTRQYPSERFVQIVGADTLLELENWKDFDEIAKMCGFFVVPREGTDCENARRYAKALAKRCGAAITFSGSASIDISSTRLRSMIERGENWEAFIPEKTAAYIKEHRLYETQTENRFDEIADRVRAALPLKRWHHTLGVVETAQVLARRFGADEDRARLAALLHDCAKPYHGQEALDLMSKYHVKLDPFSQNALKLWHGPLGAALAQHVYGVDDPEILNAIRIHTLGAAHMTKLEKIIKLADLIEPNRTYDGVERLRKIAETDLDGALLAAMEQTMGYLKGDAQAMHPDSAAAMETLRQEQRRKKK